MNFRSRIPGIVLLLATASSGLLWAQRRGGALDFPGASGAAGSGDTSSRIQKMTIDIASQKPGLRIPVAPLGFLPPGEIFLTYRLTHATLSFLDETHLLFTFHKAGLLKRAPDQSAEDDDQMIHAVLFELPSAKIRAEADWRMHDRLQYLWPLGDGHFLLRQRSTLYLSDASLELTPYLHLPGSLRLVQLDPTRKVLLTETQEKIAPAPVKASMQPEDDDRASTEEAQSQVIMRFIRLTDRTMIAAAHDRSFLHFPLNSKGWAGTLGGPEGHWSLMLRGYDRKDMELETVQSSCAPAIEMLSDDVFQATICPGMGKDRFAVAYGLDGKRLWQRISPAQQIWPTYDRTTNGSRFAVSAIVISHPIKMTDPFQPGDVSGQIVQVFDTETGKLRLTAPLSPVLDAGQNFSLSPSGNLVAVLHAGGIDIYELPPAPTGKHPLAPPAAPLQVVAPVPAQPAAGATPTHAATPATPAPASSSPEPAASVVVSEPPADPQHTHIPDLELPPLPSSSATGEPQPPAAK